MSNLGKLNYSTEIRVLSKLGNECLNSTLLKARASLKKKNIASIEKVLDQRKAEISSALLRQDDSNRVFLRFLDSKVTHLPDWFFNCTNLRGIVIDSGAESKLSDLGEVFNQTTFPHLKKVYIAQNIPLSEASLTSLRTLQSQGVLVCRHRNDRLSEDQHFGDEVGETWEWKKEFIEEIDAK